MKTFSPTASALIDSNILVAAHTEHPHHAAALQLIRRALIRKEALVFALQNLMEWYAVVTSANRVSAPLSSRHAQQLMEHYLNSDIPIISPERDTLVILIRLLNQTNAGTRRIYNLFLAATALTHGITKIYTETVKDFRDIPGITALNPFS